MMIIINQFILKKFSVMTKIKLRIKKEILEIVMKGKRYKAEIREKDNQKIEVLLRNWSHKSRTKDYKEEEEAMWLIYPKKHEAKELIYKAH